MRNRSFTLYRHNSRLAVGPGPRRAAVLSLGMVAILLGSGCGAMKKMAINQVGDALAEGNSVFATDDDIELVGDALPFGLKLMESLLSHSPRNEGMLLAACEGFTSYSYAFVQFDAEVTKEEIDLDDGRAKQTRARRLYLRAQTYGLRALEEKYEGFTHQLASDPRAAAARVDTADVPLLYWNAAALGLAISVSRDDPHMLIRLPEVEALLDRALELDEAWGQGALHEFAIVLAGASASFNLDEVPRLRGHFERALQLSGGSRASLFVSWAESVSVPTRDPLEFREMLRRALEIDPDDHVDIRLMNIVSQRRARWLLERFDDLFLGTAGPEWLREDG